MTLRRLLIANRGEIALRIVRAARARGIATVLAASTADRDSLAAKEADRTLVVGPPAARDSYLNSRVIVHAAKATGCDALHPGYGFLSERADLADLCAREGIIFVGPTAQSMRRVGDKLSARALARASGVPLVAGTGQISSADEAVSAAETIGYPVVTKASAGGGGRGMVVAHDGATLAAGFDKASNEAKEAFGDGSLYLEHYIESARHVEVQIVGDGTGRIVHFGERDCSIQRRYQKMIEEAPAAVLSDSIRRRLHQAAIDLLSPINYRNAGTVEFLFDAAREAFYFIEVNARIQVEHPVSEMLTGVDLIELQLATADGPLLLDQEAIRMRGHAIEVRIIAEDPARDFSPSPGRVRVWRPPQGRGIRLDSAISEGALVPPYYDSMIAKLIVHDQDRPAAIALLRRALGEFHIEGVATNLPLLRWIAEDLDFVANRVDTRWLERDLLPRFAGRKDRLDGARALS
jgi:acetyl-CoA carboxylase, biotin carboxylase subunit